VAAFTLEGGKAKGLRHAVNRALTAGYRFELRDPAFLEPELRDGLQQVLEGSRRGGVERGYAMTLGRVFDPQDRGLLLGIAFEPSGEPAAFCQFVPAPGNRGWSLDLMRRSDREHPNSITDFVVVSTILAIQQWGARSLVLNFATLRAVLDGAADDTWSNRVQGAVARQLSGSMQIESLWKHNAKYRPTWQARYAVYDGPEHILPSAVAVARAESFFDLPVIGRLFPPPAQPAPTA
jgi:lysyl-tRNA synthetase class 2